MPKQVCMHTMYFPYKHIGYFVSYTVYHCIFCYCVFPQKTWNQYICTDGTHNYHNDSQKTTDFLEEYLQRRAQSSHQLNATDVSLQRKCSYTGVHSTHRTKINLLADFTEIQSKHFIFLGMLTQEDISTSISYMWLYSKDSQPGASASSRARWAFWRAVLAPSEHELLCWERAAWNHWDFMWLLGTTAVQQLLALIYLKAIFATHTELEFDTYRPIWSTVM